jgi:PAS domain S-box-containing protein
MLELIRVDGTHRWVNAHGETMRDLSGLIVGLRGTVQDITERKQTEEKLAVAHSQIQSIIDNTPDIVYTFDLEERFVLANKAVANVLNSTPDQMIGKRRHEFMPKTDADWHEANDRQVFEAGRVLEFEEYSHLESHSITWLTKKFPLRDARGRIYAVAGISADITEQKKAEDALKEARDSLEVKVKERTADLEEAYNLLQENERRLSEAQKLSHIGSWDWNIVTNELNWSDETYLIFGRALQQLGSTHDAFLSYVHPDDRNYVDSAVKGAIKGKPYDIDYRIILADGSERIVHAQGGVIFNEENTPIRMRGTVQDITERKQAEEELYKNQELLRGIIDNTPALIYVLDLEERITVANRALAYLFGKTSEELIGRTRRGLMPEETALRDEENDRKVMAYGHFMEFEEHGIFNGMPKTYFTVKFPIRDTKGKIHSIAGISTDITERKKSEKALENFEIARKKEIHHRIKNNLQVISSLLDLQADKFNGRKDIQDSDVLEAFRESQDRVISMALIHEELYKDKTFKGKGFESVGFETLNFSPYIEKLAENLFLIYRLGNTDISLNMELEDDLFFNMDTAVPLGMIVNELVSNSLIVTPLYNATFIYLI